MLTICTQINLTDSVRLAIDDDFDLWMSTVTISKTMKARKPIPRNTGKPYSSSSRRKRATYQRVQKLFCRNRSRCARDMLNGCWEQCQCLCPLLEMENYWRDVFEKVSLQDHRNPDPVGPIQWDIIKPIKFPELVETIKSMKAGASGPDRMDARCLKSLPKGELIARLNLWLLGRVRSDQMLHG